MKRTLSFLTVIFLLIGCLVGCEKSADNIQNNATEATGNLTIHSDGLSLEEDGIVYESLAQKAVVKTALAYLARGKRIQYEDTAFNPSGRESEYLYQYGVRLSPEEYTSQSIGYVNCGAFTSDVYLAALNHRVSPTAKGLTAIEGEEKVYLYYPTGKETAQEKAKIEQEFRENLKMGDLIAIRYNGSRTGTGHVMLYVGGKVLEGVDGYKGTAAENTNETGSSSDAGYTYDIIHSTGNTYNYKTGTDRFESQGTVQMMSTDALFSGNNSRSVFKSLESIAIVRPLLTFNGEVPENSKNRMLYMDNIVAEKLSSHTSGMTVNPGDEITYTFSITNNRKEDVTLSVTDKLAENTTYVSGAQSVNGTALNWTVTVPAGKTKEITYTVKVKDDAVNGDCVLAASGTVGGISVVCPKVYIATTLTGNQQAALLDAVKSLKGSNLQGMALANAIYNEVLDTKDLLADDYPTILEQLFLSGDNGYYYLNWRTDYKDYIVPGLFGGRYVVKRTPTVQLNAEIQRHEKNRTRLLYPDKLMIGDIFIAAADANAEKQKLYLFLGDTMLDLNSGTYIDSDKCLLPALSYNRFAILRPSMILKSTN